MEAENLVSINAQSAYLEAAGNSRSFFLVEETPSHYLMTINLPGLPASEMQVRQEKKDLYVEGIPNEGAFRRQIYFQFHSAAKNCKTIYKDGVLWLVLPKVVIQKNHVNEQDANFLEF